jgi:hypothetical protein
MSTNRDASNTTARRGQLALYSWRQSYNYPQAPSAVYPEQSATSMNLGPSGVIPTQVYVGAQLIGQTNGGVCGCTSNFTYQGYDKKTPANS